MMSTIAALPAEAKPAQVPPPPRAKVPWWLRRYFPWLTGLEENPLYIRLAGQGYGKPFGILPRWRKESSFHWTMLPVRFGCLPFLIILVVAGTVLFGNYFWWVIRRGPMVAILQYPSGNSALRELLEFIRLESQIIGLCLAYVAGWLFVIRFFEVDASRRVRSFLHNAVQDGWGEPLALSALSPEEIERALLAAMLQAEVRFCFLLTCVVMAGLSLPIFGSLIPGFALLFGGPGPSGPPASEIALVFFIFTLTIPFVFIEAVSFSILLLGEEWRGAAARHSSSIRSTWREELVKALRALATLITAHIPGVAAAMSLFKVFLWMDRNMTLADYPVTAAAIVLFSAAAFALPGCAIVVWSARRNLKRFQGAVARGFVESLRSR